MKRKAREAAQAPIPLIARLAGASTSLLDAFEHPGLMILVDTCEAKESRASQLRSRLVDQLHGLISRDDLSERRFLMALKRDVFNGRPIHRRRHHDLWASATAWTAGRLQELARAEEELVALHSQRRDAFETAVCEERQALLAFAEDPAFRRGLALASPRLAWARLHYGGRSGRRAEAMLKSLLRYATRTVCKISPFSTLTLVTLAEASQESGIRFRPGRRRADSTVRLKRSFLDPLCRRLFRHPHLLSHLHLGLNPTLEALGGGRYRFLHRRKPQGLGEEKGTGSRARLVVLEIEGPWVDHLRELLGTGHGELLATLAAYLDERAEGPDIEGQGEALVRQCLDLGILETRPPWPSYVPRLEEALASFLAECRTEVRGLDPVLEALRTVLAAEEGFSAHRHPEEEVGHFPRLFDQLHHTVADFTDTQGRARPEVGSRAVYEDVMLSLARGESLLEVPSASLARAQADVDPLWRISGLFSPVHEIRLALGTFIEKRYGATAQVPLMSLFADTQKLWRLAKPRLQGRSKSPFDPFDLPVVKELGELRAKVRRELESSLLPEEGERSRLRLPVIEVRRIQGQIEPTWCSPVPPGMCLQPLGSGDKAWVSNGVFDGVGRVSSRFNSLLDGLPKERFLASAEARDVVTADGQTFRLLDLLFTKGNTVNVHWPQTHKVFVGPGETVELAGGRVVRPEDLLVGLGPGGRLLLTDKAGAAFLPVFLSTMNAPYLPQLYQFLLLLGIPATDLYLPHVASLPGDGVEVLPRITLGSVVVRRGQWRISGAARPLPWPGTGSLEIFVRLQRWRRDLQLPRQVYLRERFGGDEVVGSRYKPQLVDFGSPSLVVPLVEALAGDEDLVLTEALPAPAEYPWDPDAKGRRALEVVVDSALI